MVQSIIGEISIWEQSGREIFTGSITDNVLIGTKQNTGGEKLYVVGNTKIEGDVEITGQINATINANTINISDNNTNDTFYLTFVDDSGNTKTLNCDKTTTPLTYNPNTGIITAVGFTGDGSNLTNLTISNLNGLIPNSKLLNDSITIGTTEIDLGSSNNIISGLITVNSTNFNGTLNGTASVATTLTMTNTSTNVGYYLVFSSSPSTGNNTSYVNANLNYNPSTNTLTGGVFNGTSFSGNANSATTATTASVATTLSLTATTTNVGYYLVFSGSPSTGNSAILVSNTLSYNPSTDVLSCGVVNSNLSGNISTIDATTNNSDFLLTSITPTPSTYNQMLYTDITYNPQTKILKVGKIDNCFALTGSGSNLPILFIDHTATGKQFLYNNNNFYYNPTLGEFLLQGNTTTQNISASQLITTGNVGVGTTPLYKLDVYDTTSYHSQSAIRSSDQTLEISSYYQAGVGQYSYLQSRQETTITNYSHLLLNPSGGNVGIGLTNPSSALQVVGLKATTPATRGIHLGEDTTDGNNSIEICQGSGTVGYIDFTTTGSDFKGRILYNHSVNDFQIYTNSGVLGMLINNAGYVGIGTASPNEKLTVSGNFSIRNPAGQTVISMINSLSGGVWNFFTNYSASFNNLHIQNATGGGGVYMSPGDTFWRAISDDRLKHNEIEITNGLDVIMKMKPVFYDRSSEMLDANFNGNLDDLNMTYYKESGFIAQEVYEIDELKHIVDVGDEERAWSIQYPQIIAYNTGAIKQLKKENDELKNENTYLKNKIIDLENNIELIMEHLDLI